MKGAEISSVFRKIQGRFPVFYAWYEAMHTRLDVVICGENEKAARSVAGRIYEMIFHLSQGLNRFDPGSEIYKINHLAGIEAVPVSPELWDILTDALDASGRTNAFFDIRVDSECEPYPGDPGIVMDEASRTIRFSNPAIHLDLGGYAKGYALEKAREMILKSEISGALLSFGNSSVLGLGNRPMGSGWLIGVEHPLGNKPPVLEIPLNSESMSTSGNSSRNPVHIYSPIKRTFVSGLKMVTVVSSSALEAEIFSTAVMACGSVEEMKDLLKKAALVSKAYYITYQEDTGELTGIIPLKL